jgi:hypothetical protein
MSGPISLKTYWRTQNFLGERDFGETVLPQRIALLSLQLYIDRNFINGHLHLKVHQQIAWNSSLARISTLCFQIAFNLNRIIRENYASGEILSRGIFVSAFIKESRDEVLRCEFLNILQMTRKTSRPVPNHHSSTILSFPLSSYDHPRSVHRSERRPHLLRFIYSLKTSYLRFNISLRHLKTRY